MPITAATPYLILGGKAQEAIEFYKSALGAKVQSVQRFGEVMESCPDAIRDWVMHAALELGDAQIFMSDGGPGEEPKPGGPVNVALNIEGASLAHASFDALSAGGTVIEPLKDAPWGSLFGAVVDRYGISWMFNSTKT